jgi:iron complex outermembrane receptor protein
MKNVLLAGAIASAFVASTGARAQQQPATPAVKKLETITVTASPLNASEETMAQPVQVITGDELRRKRASSLGETLSQEPGVQSSAFGPGAGRPIIRGFDAARVQVLENGIGTLDVSTISPDHAVTVEPLRARQIEILRGPATLLYGGGAIGGVVNVVTDSIPRERLEAPTGAAEVKGGSANRLREGGFDVTVPAGPSFAVHADGFKRRTRNYEIAGPARRDDPESPTDKLPDSFVDSKGGTAGASWVGERGFLGASFGTLRSEYGIPSGEGSHISLKQDRQEIGGELANPSPGFVKMKLRAGFNDYEHREIEASGGTATTFKNKAREARLELLHAPWSGVEGAIGIHAQNRDFSALGEEAVVPATNARSLAAFVLERKTWDAWTLEGGARIERERRNPEGDHAARSYSPVSLSAGAIWRFGGDFDLHVNATRSERAPAIEELYSNGAHAATASFEIGNEDLRKETAQTLDVSLHKSGGPASWKVTVFTSRIRNFISARSVDTDGDGVADRVNAEGGLEAGGEFLLQNFGQQEARFHGFEAEWRYRPESKAWGVRLFADAVRGKFVGGSNVPRMAPARFGVDLEGRSGLWNATLTVLRAREQSKVAELETTTPGYTRVDAEIAYELAMGGRGMMTIFLQGSNLLDKEIRLHTSFLKDVAPLMGRSFQAGARYTF